MVKKMPNSKRILILIYAFMLFLFGGGLERVHALPDLVTFSFSKAEVKTLQGSSDSCSGKEIASVDIIGNLALVARPHSDGKCYNRAQYAHANFLTKRGVLTSSAGATYPAYEIHEPQHKATSFLASPHAVYYKFPTREDYSIYRFDAGILEKVATVLAADITLGDYVPVPVANSVVGERNSEPDNLCLCPESCKVECFYGVGTRCGGSSYWNNTLWGYSKVSLQGVAHTLRYYGGLHCSS